MEKMKINGKDMQGEERKKNLNENTGGRHLITLVPGLFGYGRIKENLKNPEFTKKEKAAICTLYVGLELILDAVRIGSVYGIYRLYDYLF
jgi:hypothetical protein